MKVFIITKVIITFDYIIKEGKGYDIHIFSIYSEETP